MSLQEKKLETSAKLRSKSSYCSLCAWAQTRTDTDSYKRVSSQYFHQPAYCRTVVPLYRHTNVRKYLPNYGK